MKKEHKIILGLGVGVVSLGVLYYMYNKETTQAASNAGTMNFIGKSPYVSSDGGGNGLCCVDPRYTQDKIQCAMDGLERHGKSQLQATNIINQAMLDGKCITNGALCCKKPICTCCGFCLCNPSKGINWYNPFTWKF